MTHLAVPSAFRTASPGKLGRASEEDPGELETPAMDVDTACTLAVRLWNINGGFLLKMTCPDFREEITKYDINVFQETRLEEGHIDMVEEIEDYDMWSMERAYRRDDDEQWGGVVVVARRTLGLKRWCSMTSTDILVLQSPNLVLVGAYILPEGSNWEPFADVSPFDKLVEVMGLLRGEERPVLVMGDLNARVGAADSYPNLPRVSKDTTATTRGRALMRVCCADQYRILNGLERLGASSGNMTSHHKGCGEAVVDYAIANTLLSAETVSLAVRDGRPDWSDHSELVLTMRQQPSPGLDVDSSKLARVPRRRRQLGDVYGDSGIDLLVLEAIASIPTPGEEVQLLYGPAYCTTNAVQIYVDGSSRDNGGRRASAGAGVYYGPGSKKNAAVRVPDSPTNNRAEIYAVYHALRTSNPHQTLLIHCDSEYVINMLTEWAADRQSSGWRITNGDIFRDVVYLLRSRPAPVTFRKVKAHSGNAHNDAADALAKEGTTKPVAAPYQSLDRQAEERKRCACSACMKTGLVVLERKVTGDLGRPRGGGGKTGVYTETEDVARSALTVARTKEKEAQLDGRMRLFSARTPLQFYKEFNAIRNPKSKSKSAFVSEDMRDEFEVRMNPVHPMPPSFDVTRMKLNREVASALVHDGAEDRTPRKSTSRPFVVEELELAKLSLKKRWGSAKGEDHVTYQDISGMDNECLLRLANQCVKMLEIPKPWLRTQLIGLCKKGRPKDLPSSYRTIALESCFLKLLTGLVKDRLVELADDLNLLPPSQNGFREGYRTNNNAFILRCAAEKAKANGTALYTAFIDLTNAFPSTDQDTLWLKLQNWGAGGPIFDWLRRVYRDMTYYVYHDGKTSSDFTSSIGILIGNTCSPILWALFMADLPDFIPKDEDDVRLGNVAVTNLEQADDVVLLSSTAEGLQRKLQGMYHWCAKNFMQFNTTKSVVMIVGKKPTVLPAFYVGEGDGRIDIDIVVSVTYLGISLSSKPGAFVREHYTTKAEKAKKASRVISGVQQLVGTLPVPVATRLYMALVDPHLTHGCEIALDSNDTARGLLETVQKGYLRKVIRVGTRCIEVILYTETGLVPVHYRRVELSLRFLMYAAECPRGHYVREALEEVVTLDFEGHDCWISDLRRTVERLPFSCPFPPHDLLGNPEVISDTITQLKKGVRAYLQRLVDTSPKLYLLHGRLEEDESGELAQPVPILLRHYMRVFNPAHRVALAKVMLSGHKYGIESLRRGRAYVLQENRRCRLCGEAVETPEHIWLECGAEAELCTLRRQMAADVAGMCSRREGRWLSQGDGDVLEQMKRLVAVRSSVARVAQFAYEVDGFMARTVNW